MSKTRSLQSSLLLILFPIALAEQPGHPPSPAAVKVEQSIKAIDNLPLCSGASNDALFGCAKKKATVYEAYLTATYSKLAAYLKSDKDKTAYNKLLASQRIWVKFREADCGLYPLTSPGGNLGDLSRVYCLGNYAKTRAQQLEDLYAQFTQGQ